MFRHVLALLFVASLAGLAPAERAHAHVALLSTEPAADSAYESAPRHLRLRFTDAVTPVALRLRDSQGRRYALTESPRAEGATLEVALPADLPPAIYIVDWRVVGADSHPAAGNFVFSVATEIPIGFLPTPAGATDPLLQALNVLLRFVVTASVLLAAGAVMFELLVARAHADARRSVARVAAAGALGALAAILARGALLLDAEDLSWASAWSTGLETSLGTSMVFAAAGLATIAAAAIVAPRARWVPVLGAELALVSFALSGHVATVEPAALFGAIVALHVALASFWLGALPALAAQLRADPAGAPPVLARFSRVALWGVAGLVALGLAMSIVQVADPVAIGGTAYGRLLAIKLVAVVGLFTLAAGNRLIHTQALARGDLGAARRLLRAIRWEGAAFVVVLAATATLSLTPPPRAFAITAEPHVHGPDGVAATAAGQRISAIVEVAPGHVGRNRIALDFLDADGRGFAPQVVIVELTRQDDDRAPLRLRPRPRSHGGYVADDVELPRAGRWTIRIEVAAEPLGNESLVTEIDIK